MWPDHVMASGFCVVNSPILSFYFFFFLSFIKQDVGIDNTRLELYIGFLNMKHLGSSTSLTGLNSASVLIHESNSTQISGSITFK